QVVAVKVVLADNDLQWSTETVFSHGSSDAWVSVRTSRESSSPAVRLPTAKKPLLIRALLDGSGGGRDGQLDVSDQPHRLSNDDIETAANLMLGRAAGHLPVVYVSAGFSGGHL